MAHRLRRAEPAHDVRRQADARPRADAGHRARQPRVQGQARRAGGRLPGARRRAEAGARDLHRERRHGAHGARSGRGRRGDAGEVRGLLRRSSTASTGRSGRPARRRSGSACCRPRRSTSSRRRTARTAACAPCASCRRRSRWRCRTTRRCASATTWRSSRRCGRCSPSARRATRGPRRSSTTPSGRSSRGRWRPDEVVDIFAAAGLEKPDISILSDEFLAEVRGMPQRNLAVELLQKLLKGEIKHAAAQERRAGALVRRDARAGDPPLPEPRHRDGAGDRGADRAGEGHARGRRSAARSSG